MMYGNGPWGMMGGYGGGLMWIVLLVAIVLVIFFVMRWAKPGGAGETHLDILKKRYAKGELTKEEYDQKKKDLEL
jgi:putative membrane protein